MRHQVDQHIKEQLSNHVVDLVKTINAEIGVRRNESPPQEQASQNELLTTTQHLSNENDEMRHIIEGLSNTVHHLQQQIEDLRAKQERPLQEANIRYGYWK